ncbi:LOW QUALITY PROTEIN: hypothetical protein CFOL_v3_24402, partial [Cephalotus follicularis]
IEVAHSNKDISLSQGKYTLDLLHETGMLGCKPANTPLEPNSHLKNKEGKPVDKGSYQRLEGRLIYPVAELGFQSSGPDIAFVVSVVSQYMHDHHSSHLEAAYRILRYLKSSPGRGILFSPNSHLAVEAYTDADAGCPDNTRSTSGYCTFVGGNLVTWRSKKQVVVARSSAKAEFRSVAHGLCEFLWLQGLLADLNFPVQSPMKLFCDSKSAISIAHNPMQNDRTKHVEIDRHFIKEKLTRVIIMHFVSSETQLAGVFTKGLGGKLFCPIVSKLGMIDIHA